MRYVFVSVQEESPETKRNTIVLAPFVESFNEWGEITIQMSRNFTSQVETWMINSTVLNITIGTRGNNSQSRSFSWEATEVNITSFKIQLRFADVFGLTDKDVFSMKFINPGIFYANKNVSTAAIK